MDQTRRAVVVRTGQELRSVDHQITVAMADHFRDFRDRLAGGAGRLGFKVAFNPPQVQKKLGLPYSLVAGLTTATLQAGPEHGLGGATAPALEAEVSVRLGGPVRASDTPAAAAAAIEAVAPAIEVVDYNRPLDQLPDVIREGVYHRAVFFGEACPPPADAGLSGVRASIILNGKSVAEVDAEEATGRLPDLLLHIARVLSPFDLEPQAGDRLILGSMNAPAIVKPGDRFALALAGYGTVELAFGA